MLAEVKTDILTGHVISADFHVVSATEKVHARIPVVLRGESPGVKLGGVLEHLMHEVHVDSLVTDIPTEIVVDISDMDIGERFRVEDLPELSGVVFMDPAEEVIVLIASPRVAEVVEEGPGRPWWSKSRNPKPSMARRNKRADGPASRRPVTLPPPYPQSTKSPDTTRCSASE